MEEILLVTTFHCPKCREAATKLYNAGVNFKLCAAEENAEYVLEKLGLTEAPALVIRPEGEYETYTKIYSGLGGVYRFLRSLEKNE